MNTAEICESRRKPSVFSPATTHYDNVDIGIKIYHLKHMVMLSIWRLFSLSSYFFNLVGT